MLLCFSLTGELCWFLRWITIVTHITFTYWWHHTLGRQALQIPQRCVCTCMYVWGRAIKMILLGVILLGNRRVCFGAFKYQHLWQNSLGAPLIFSWHQSHWECNGFRFVFLFFVFYCNTPPNTQKNTEKRGGVSSSSLSFKETCTETGPCEQSCFRQGTKWCWFTHDHWGILTKVYCRHFMKTLKNHTNLWKNRHLMSPLTS